MTNVRKTNRHYVIPGTIDPEGDRQYIIRCPDSDDYALVLFDHLNQLTWSAMHDPDASKTQAAQVARRWEQALEYPPERAGDSGMFELRQNEDNIWQLQQSLDGGETWTLAYDFSLTPIVPAYPPIYLLPLPDGRSTDTATYDLMLDVYRSMIINVVASYDNSETEYNALQILNTYVAQYANVNLYQYLAPVVTAVYAATPEERTAAQLPEAYIETRGEDVCLSRLEEWQPDEDFPHWLQGFSDNFANGLQTASDTLVQTLNSAARVLQGDTSGLHNFMIGMSGGGGGTGFGGEVEECTSLDIWYADCDFLTSPCGFAIMGDGTAGEWIEGIGWQTLYSTPCGWSGSQRLNVGYHHPMWLLQLIWSGNFGSQIWWNTSGWACDEITSGTTPLLSPNSTADPSAAQYNANIGRCGFLYTGAVYQMTRAQIWGVGPNPFEE